MDASTTIGIATTLTPENKQHSISGTQERNSPDPQARKEERFMRYVDKRLQEIEVKREDELRSTANKTGGFKATSNSRIVTKSF